MEHRARRLQAEQIDPESGDRFVAAHGPSVRLEPGGALEQDLEVADIRRR